MLRTTAVVLLAARGASEATARPAPSAGVLSGPARVIDGDTLEVAGRRVRLHGRDAPERSQACERGGRRYACGQAAARALAALLAGRAVRCTARGRNRYGRTVAVCRVGGADVGEAMVHSGWAVALRPASRETRPRPRRRPDCA